MFLKDHVRHVTCVTQYQAYVLSDGSVSSEDTLTHADTPSIRSYSLMGINIRYILQQTAWIQMEPETDLNFIGMRSKALDPIWDKKEFKRNVAGRLLTQRITRGDK
jgi:hypothetical protein